jgi:small subunit ribosomal protein S5
VAVQSEWIPKTKLGKLVKDGKVSSIKDIMEYNMPIREYQIIDVLLPNLETKIIHSGVVQRQTDAGEVNSFKIVTVVGNKTGFVGIGSGKSRQLNEAQEKALIDAKLHITYVERGCGAWECRCGTPHSVPYKMYGKAGSVGVLLMPAPKGTGIVASEIARQVLTLAGILDVWVQSFGETRNRINTAYATLNALRLGLRFKKPVDWSR